MRIWLPWSQSWLSRRTLYPFRMIQSQHIRKSSNIDHMVWAISGFWEIIKDAKGNGNDKDIYCDGLLTWARTQLLARQIIALSQKSKVAPCAQLHHPGICNKKKLSVWTQNNWGHNSVPPGRWTSQRTWAEVFSDFVEGSCNILKKSIKNYRVR